jgi:hypothetical protein
MRIREAQKHTDPTDPDADPEHCQSATFTSFFKDKKSYLPKEVMDSRIRIDTKMSWIRNTAKMASLSPHSNVLRQLEYHCVESFSLILKMGAYASPWPSQSPEIL